MQEGQHGMIIMLWMVLILLNQSIELIGFSLLIVDSMNIDDDGTLMKMDSRKKTTTIRDPVKTPR